MKRAVTISAIVSFACSADATPTKYAEQCAYELAAEVLPIADNTVGIHSPDQLVAMLDIARIICKSDDDTAMVSGIGRALEDLKTTGAKKR